MRKNLVAGYEDLSERTRAIQALLDQNDLFRRYFNLNLSSHRQVCVILHRLILKRLNFPFAMADFSCGNATMIGRVLKGTQVSRFIGIDLSSRALDEARKNMQKIPCHQSFIQADFYDIAQIAVGRLDLIWLNLTLHHLSYRQKKILLDGCAEILSGRGCLLIYDPIMNESESREQYVERWWSAYRERIQKLTRHAPQTMLRHIHNDDQPLNMTEYKYLGWECGFSEIESLYTDPLNCHSLICYRH